MVINIESLTKKYSDWLFQNTTTRKVKDTIEITLPYLDRNNDCIQVYLKELEDGKLLLTDAGYTITDLQMTGFTLDSERRHDLLQETIDGFAIILTEDNELQTITTEEDFPQKLNDLIQAMQEIDDLSNLAVSNVSRIFTEDIKTWLKERKVRYASNVDIRGKNGVIFNFKLLLPAGENAPERFVEPYNSIDLRKVQAIAYKWSQIKYMREGAAKMYVLYDKLTSKQRIEDICTADDITLIQYADLQNHEAELTA